MRGLLQKTAWLLALQALLTVGWELFQQHQEDRYLKNEAGATLASWNLPDDPLAKAIAAFGTGRATEKRSCSRWSERSRTSS